MRNAPISTSPCSSGQANGGLALMELKRAQADCHHRLDLPSAGRAQERRDFQRAPRSVRQLHEPDLEGSL